MYSFFETLKNIWKITELRDRIFITLFFLAIYRLGAQVVLPGIDSVQLAELSSRTQGGGLLGILKCLYRRSICKCICFCFRNNAIYLCINCCSINGYCSSLFTKTTKRRRKRQKNNQSNNQMANNIDLCSSGTCLFI